MNATVKMRLPFHGIHVCGDIFFAARGRNIHCFSTDGTHISCWQYPVDEKAPIKAQKNGHATPAAALDDNDDGPPAKRVKLENDGQNETGSQKKAKAKGNANQQRGHSNMPPPSEQPMVTMMASSTATGSQNAKHLVAVTADKSIWVFEHDGRGELKQLSRRTMPKRPCSIVLSPDNKDILSADKFGDVYAVPLLPSEQPKSQPSVKATQEASPPTPEAVAADTPTPAPTTTDPSLGPFTPQASELTVHTARNRKALTSQLISRTNPKSWGGTPKRAVDAFERHLLLGHVSLLTAIALGHDAARRPYIITADRDEHIRVSRGTRDQAHVIERYCMGHEQFVNRLLVAGELLLSGGGDGEVFVWRWMEGTVIARADVLGRVREVVEGAEKIAITGLSRWSGALEDNLGMRIMAICERVPAIFVFSLTFAGALEFSRTIKLPGNPFEIGVVNDNKLIVAVDPSHKEASEYDVKTSLLSVENVGGEYLVMGDVIKNLGTTEANACLTEDVSPEEFDKMLYSAETLRKMWTEDKESMEARDEPDSKDNVELKQLPML